MSEQRRPGVARPGDLRALVERSPVATLTFGLPVQRVRDANEAAAELIGSPQSAIVGLRPAQVYDGVDGRRAQMSLSALALGALDSYRAHRQLRTSRGPVSVSTWVRRVPVVGGPVAVVIVVPDTTLENGSLGAFFEAEVVDLAVGTLNGDGRIDRVIPQGAVVFGQNQSELIGVDLASLVHPDDVGLLLRSVRNTAASSEGAFVRVRLRDAAGGWVETRCLFFPLPADESSSTVFVLAQSATELPPRPDAERTPTLERLAASWRYVRPLGVDASHLVALDKLPRRQREIVDRLLRGERVPSIAASMYISATTVRNHLSHAFTAFGVHSQSELLALLRRGSGVVQRAEPEHRY
jgi:PAS domain-containing protein/DNA-binding CsgD family transcriptional regulator